MAGRFFLTLFEECNGLREPQKLQRLFHVGRYRGGKADLLPRARMGESQLVGVEQDAWCFVVREFGELLGLALAVGVVSGDGEAEVLKVNADLMRATRV